MEEEDVPKSGSLDSIDKEIIDILRQDARKSFREIAEQINKTEATVRRRFKELVDQKIITRFTIVVPDNNLKVIIKISPDLARIKEITQELLKIEQITDIWRLSGECGLFIRVQIPDIKYLDPLIEERLSLIPGVEIRETCIVTREIKNNY